MPPTPQQLAIVGHDPSKNGRVVAGPGTGISWVSVALIKRLKDEKPDLKVGLLTFTRAATGELVKKVGAAALDGVNPSTVHSFALSILLRNQAACSLPLPLRLPDSYELGLRTTL
jgi:superfamily I DNA/RNA helicase